MKTGIEITTFINKSIKLSRGRVTARCQNNVVYVTVGLLVVPREAMFGPDKKIDLFPVETSFAFTVEFINNCIIEPKQNILQHVQRAWSSLWMHESLETFGVVDETGELTRPFDPHCAEHTLDPFMGNWLANNENCG